MKRGPVENNRVECRLGCGKTIHFIRSVSWCNISGRYKPGSYIPCETPLLTGNGEKTLVLIWPVSMRGRVVPKAGNDMQGFEPHFANCEVHLEKQRERARRRQKRAVQMSLF